ncbi:MAG TPA: phosphonate C-P lyase system protein PhnH [Ramlibacter sp.]|nr:phosphonate C-P lyase system protein PhnH [Ramlibacter sp.]
MNTHDLQQVRPGFTHEALGSQAVFRAALDALSHPGRLQQIPATGGSPRTGHAAAASLLLATLDADCSVWLSPTLRASDAAAWLRFHTGCQLVDAPEEALFLWIAQGDHAPELQQLMSGSDAYPDQSATCVIEVMAMNDAAHSAAPWTLQGPGIATHTRLSVDGAPTAFEAQWERNHASFPRGVDVFLATATHIAGLPRTTRITQAMES